MKRRRRELKKERKGEDVPEKNVRNQSLVKNNTKICRKLTTRRRKKWGGRKESKGEKRTPLKKKIRAGGPTARLPARRGR